MVLHGFLIPALMSLYLLFLAGRVFICFGMFSWRCLFLLYMTHCWLPRPYMVELWGCKWLHGGLVDVWELMGCLCPYVDFCSLDSSVWVGRAWSLASAWVSCCPLFLAVCDIICFGCYLDGPPLCTDDLQCCVFVWMVSVFLCMDELCLHGSSVSAW